MDAEKRDSVVDDQRGLVSRAREFDGCMHVAITADSVDPETDQLCGGVARHRATEQWRGQANAPEVEESRYIAVKRYDATDGGPLF